MRNKLLILTASLVLSLSAFLLVIPNLQTTVKAACGTIGANGQCPSGMVYCGTGVRCCDTPAECTSATTPPAATTPPGSGSTGGTSQILNGNCLDTAIGCIPIDSEGGFFSFLLSWAIGIGGGISFLMIIFASFQIMTSQGDPKRLQAGQELLYSAIMGLILLVLSVFILRIIGVNLFGFII